MQTRGFIEEYRSWVEIDLEQLRNNYISCKKSIDPQMGIIAVIKANAYGHGDIKIAKTLEECGVSFFAVSNINEAIRLRTAGIQGEILILGYTSPSYCNLLYELNVTQAIVSKQHAEAIYNTGYKIKCHFAIDTGMNRIGLQGDNPLDCEMTIRDYFDKLNITGVFTHFCVADSIVEEDHLFTISQANKFCEITRRIADLNLPYIHSVNSAASLSLANRYSIVGLGNMVRLGIVLYGLKPDFDFSIPSNIAPILTWKSTVSMVKNVDAGATIGYGRSFKTKSACVIATITTGYADGFNRLLSNKGHVLINGKIAKIVGRICMDQFLVDVTHIENVSMGTTAILIGRSGDIEYNADDMARDLNTINYEIVCGISSRVQRTYKCSLRENDH